jgi:hypothetical protein
MIYVDPLVPCIRNRRVTIELPNNYERKPLPGMNKWVEALRSGKYPQGRHALCREGKFCCLGVKCELEGLAKKIVSEDSDVVYCDTTASLPDQSESYYILGSNGLIPDCASVTLGVAMRLTLAGLNDKGATFEEIAFVIESLWRHADE